MIKFARIMTKIVEVGHWVGAALMAAALGCLVFAPQMLRYFIWIDTSGEFTELSFYSLHVIAAVSEGKVDSTVLGLCLMDGVIVFVLMAIVFRSLYLIFRKSEGTTPFQAENVRRLKRIGILTLVVPVVSQMMCTIIGTLPSGFCHISSTGDGYILGILVLCLTQFFAHGVELEKEVDGLL